MCPAGAVPPRNFRPWTPFGKQHYSLDTPPNFESVHGLWVVFFFKEIFQEFMWTCRHQSKLLLYFTSLLYLYYFECLVLLRSAMKSSYQKKLVLKEIWWNHNPCINLELSISIDNKSILEIYILCILQSYHLNGDFFNGGSNINLQWSFNDHECEFHTPQIWIHP